VAEEAPAGATAKVKPAIFAVDDDPQVLAAVARDLRRKYGDEYRVVRAGDGKSALEALDELILAGQPVALVVADQRMPEMSGVELLEKVKAAEPLARTVLLTAYADTEAAISAINKVQLNRYILKPWSPPEDLFYPILDDLLEDWRAEYHPRFEGVRLLGQMWSKEAHRIREFLARNLIPYQWLDVDSNDPEVAKIREAAGDPGLPLVVLPNGDFRVEPTNRELANLIGLHTTSETDTYDLLIIGAGPAGLAAAVYASSEGLKTAVLEREAPGGQASLSAKIENYLGFPSGLSGSDLARRALDQARRLGAEILSPVDVIGLSTRDSYRMVACEDGSVLAASSIIVATGVSYQMLKLEGAEAFHGAGLFYGASMHDARRFTGSDVALVGAANSAGQAALHLARFARKVTMIVRGDNLDAKMSAYLVKQILDHPLIEVRFHSQVVGVRGGEHLEEMEVVGPDGERVWLPTAALFVMIGAAPRTDWLEGAVARDEKGYLLVGPELTMANLWKEARAPFSLETSLPGVFAAGDVRATSLKRVASAVGEGAIAVHYVHRYLGL
jgi:thioredoxin reductase (NADPH)